MKINSQGFATVIIGLLALMLVEWWFSGLPAKVYFTSYTAPTTVTWIFLGGLLAFNALVWGLVSLSHLGKLK